MESRQFDMKGVLVALTTCGIAFRLMTVNATPVGWSCGLCVLLFWAGATLALAGNVGLPKRPVADLLILCLGVCGEALAAVSGLIGLGLGAWLCLGTLLRLLAGNVGTA